MQTSKKNVEGPAAAKAPEAKDAKGEGSKKKAALGGETDPAAAEKKLAPAAEKKDAKKSAAPG